MDIPIRKLINLTFQKPWSVRTSLTKALMLPIAFGCILEILAMYYSVENAAYYIYEIAGTLVYILIAITCHRLILIGKGAVPEFGINRWTMRETWFFLWTGLLYFGLPYVYFNWLLKSYMSSTLIDDSFWLYVLTSWMVIIPYFFVLTRLSLIFPHIALGNSGEAGIIKWSWKLTKNNTWRLIVLYMLFPFLLFLPFYYISDLLGERPEGSLIYTIDLFLWTFTSYILTIFVISAVSVSYQWLIDNK